MYQMEPMGVVIPRHADDVQAGIAVEADVAFDAAAQLVLEVTHGEDYRILPARAQRNCAGHRTKTPLCR